MSFDMDDLRNLDFNNIGEWPSVVRWGFIVFAFAVVLFIGYKFDTSVQNEKLATITHQEVSLKQQVAFTLESLQDLHDSEKNLQKMRSDFVSVLKSLPATFNVPTLLDAISKVGQENGLKFKLLKPKLEVKEQFYAYIPVKIVAIGDYHQIAKFVSDLANLSQPIRFTELEIEIDNTQTLKSTEHSKVARHENLELELTAELYRNNIEVTG